MELVEGRKPDLSRLPTIQFGAVVLAYIPTRDKSLDPRAEYGIMVGWHLDAPKAIRVYFPHQVRWEYEYNISR